MPTQLPSRLFLPALVLGAALGLSCGGAQGEDGTTPAVSDALGSSEAGQEAQYGGQDKVAVCHIPPGNPSAAHVIVVGPPAVNAHLKHGDYLGDCVTSGGTDNPYDGGSGGSTNGGSDSDGGTGTCVQGGGACGEGVGTCCEGLMCDQQQCVPNIG